MDGAVRERDLDRIAGDPLRQLSVLLRRLRCALHIPSEQEEAALCCLVHVAHAVRDLHGPLREREADCARHCGRGGHAPDHGAVQELRAALQHDREGLYPPRRPLARPFRGHLPLSLRGPCPAPALLRRRQRLHDCRVSRASDEPRRHAQGGVHAPPAAGPGRRHQGADPHHARRQHRPQGHASVPVLLVPVAVRPVQGSALLAPPPRRLRHVRLLRRQPRHLDLHHPAGRLWIPLPGSARHRHPLQHGLLF
mmetsp:Transcript_1903/g.6803  ORF Transcript_1903/g.6803 Transcript_1903/m.6803 type:complete len:252 (-) Transcript_1903:910-1665(-)